MNIIRPMLAAKQPPSWSKETFLHHIYKHLPLYGQYKFDGIRCIIDADGCPRSRTWKLIKNAHIRRTIKALKLPYGFDGELITRTKHILDDFNTTSSKAMSKEGESDFDYVVFDYAVVSQHYSVRKEMISNILKEPYHPVLIKAMSKFLVTIDDVNNIISDNNSFEGVIFRNPNSLYKQGRSTLKEMALVAYKFWEQSEAVVIGFDELMHNENAEESDAFGNTERQSCKENQKPGNVLGALRVRDLTTNVEFSIGTGFAAEERKRVWITRSIFMNKIVTYKYQHNRTKLNKPIHPSFVGWRDKEDM